MDVPVEMLFHRSRMRSTERSPASDARVYLGIGEMQGICTAIVAFCVYMVRKACPLRRDMNGTEQPLLGV